METSKIFKFIFIVFFIAFMFLVIASKSGYYEYELMEKRRLTDEAIERFERDVESGKSIDINDYLNTKSKDYNNRMSNLGNKITETVESVFSSGFNYLFRYINRELEK